jgi:hypothetical protein
MARAPSCGFAKILRPAPQDRVHVARVLRGSQFSHIASNRNLKFRESRERLNVALRELCEKADGC